MASARKPANGPASYDRAKEHLGQRYTGMQVGRTHHWHYNRGDWKERKVTPEQWELTYAVTKRRAGKAPEGSGAPVGTGYHWFIFAHQYVEKRNANDYLTHMVGIKYKLAHRRAGKTNWSASGNAQKEHLVRILKDLIAGLQESPQQLTPIPLRLEYRNKHYEGTAVPVPGACAKGACYRLDITLNRKHLGILRRTGTQWKLSALKSTGLVRAIGAQVSAWYR